MKSWSIQKKLVGLCSILVGSIMAVGGFHHFGTKLLVDTNSEISRIQLPAVRDIDFINMMHDNIRATVYQALFLSSQEGPEGKSQVAQEFEEYSAGIKKNISDIGGLKLQPLVQKNVTEVRPEISVYLRIAKEILELSLAGKKDVAIAKLPYFQKAYGALDKKLDILTDMIEKEAQASQVRGEKKAQWLELISLFLILASVSVGVLVSVWIVRDLMRSLSHVIERLSCSSEQVSKASTESATTATKLSEAATQQAASLQQTMASVEEISAMVSQNSDSAGRAKSVVDGNQRVSEEGAQSVNSMLKAIEEIKLTNDEILAQMESSNKEFGDIVKIISDIGEKTKVINDIVFQTKLLSFNASVEAARAGEHGKGFAVVAEEVGSLAQMSGTAAKEITSLLSASTKKVNEIVEATTKRVDQLVETGKDKISLGESTAMRCRDALERVSENARSVAAMVTEIAHASKEQAQGIQEINKAIAQLDQVTQQNSSVAQQSSTQAEHLRSEAHNLSEVISALVLSVNGGAGKKPSSPENEPIPVPKKSTPAPVVDLLQRRKAMAVEHNDSKARVANSDVVPSGDDPQFEEF